MSVAKLEILEDTFKNKFDIEKFKKFTREFFNEPDMIKKGRRIGIWREYDNHINSYYTIATYEDSQGNKVLVMAVELKKDVSVDRARSMQRNFVSKVLDENNLDAAIVAFYTTNEPSWRLSFVRLDYSFTDKGITLDLTPARRYSYLVGENEPNNTARVQLLPIFEDDKYNPTLDEIENAFSVEKVTKDFFEQYKKKYLDLKEHLENNEEFIDETTKLGFEVEKFSEQFAKKLMGQLAFLYFLQKKGWLGVKIVPKIISKQELFTLCNSVDETKKKILNKIYLKNKGDKYILNIDLISSKDFTEHEAGLLSDIFVNNEKYNEPWGSGYKQFIRDVLWKHCERHKNNFFNDYLEPFFYNALNTKRENHYFKEFNCKIPFLNGGLFEPLEGYHWKDIDFEIPNELFSNKKDGDKEADGILDIFDRFNFTINEDEPLEKEVAIDPEMLGKIFENLLEVKDRKSKGAFYTPREIVHYMCQESLINYLVNEVNVSYDDIKEFILYGELIKDADNRRNVGYGKDFTIKQSIFDNIVEIDNALENVRVADPAVGSGAFPLGMLNEIIRARNNITEYIIRKDKEGAFDRRYGEEFIRKWRSPYKMKWETIKNCIFAVDVEPSAVDITKLRLWLSVVIEQEIDDENPEPHPLPNLDMNIHVGNSLIDEYEGIKLFDENILLKSKDRVEENNSEYMGDKSMQIGLFVDPTEELLKRMFELQDRYFDEENEERKKQFKADIDKTRDELIRHKLYMDGNKETLKKYEESFKNKTKPYFIWELEFAKVFKEKGGFDIIIGNPPYIDSEEMTQNLEDTRKFCKYRYSSAKGNWDIFVVFIEKGINILKNRGNISYIVPNKLIGAKYTEELRKILMNYSIQEIRDYSVVNVFREADVYPIVFRLEKSQNKNHVNINIMDSRTNLLSTLKIKPELFYRDIYWDRYITQNKETISIIEKCLKGIPLEKLAQVKGAATVSEAYMFKESLIELSDETILLSKGNKYMKFINTGVIDRYISLWDSQNVRYIKQSYNKPIMHCRDIQNISSTRLEESKKEKIIVGGMNKYLECFYDKGEYIAGKSTSIIYDSKISLKYLLAVLNSKLISFYYRNYFRTLSLKGGYLRIGPPQLKMIPIIVNEDEADKIEAQVDKLLQGYKEGRGTGIIREDEKILDEYIYNLYNMNKKEIKIIEELYEGE